MTVPSPRVIEHCDSTSASGATSSSTSLAGVGRAEVDDEGANPPASEVRKMSDGPRFFLDALEEDAEEEVEGPEMGDLGAEDREGAELELEEGLDLEDLDRSRAASSLAS